MKSNLGQCTPTSCPKAGIKIHESNNDYKKSPFNMNSLKKDLPQQVNTLNNQMNMLDLNLANYELKDIFKLFLINQNTILTDDVMKEAKKVVLKLHPDKSQLDPKFFIFYSGAYKKLFEVYEFQNKSTNKSQRVTTYENVVEDISKDNRALLNNLFTNNKELKDSKNFNTWFNERFDKFKVEDDLQNGYGNWLKSDEDLNENQEQVTQANMNEVFEQKKKQLQAVAVYRGVENSSFGLSNFFGGASLDNQVENYTTDSYTDLKQAYTETVIPVTEEDFRNTKTYRNVEEYKRARDSNATTPLTKAESERILANQARKESMESQSLAFKWAQQTERAKENNNMFWSDLRQIKY
jgi:hypothetical protein